ncbi:MAG: AAA family ATPase [Bacteroidales bacterium]|nr:AAA family ATPase [Bacteroidales bacterium]
MKILKVKISKYKNLNDFEINFESNPDITTVLVGENAVGKSNFFEFLVILFRDLDLHGGKPQKFSSKLEKEFYEHPFSIEYEFKKSIIKIENIKQKNIFKLSFKLKGKIISKSELKNNSDKYLPKHLFVYYSGLGNSNRIETYFDTHFTRFVKKMRKKSEGDEEEPLRRLFYAKLLHSYFALISFFGQDNDKLLAFLNEHLGIIGIESILFVLREPYWAKSGKKISEDGDPKFWGAKGAVKRFLKDLYEISLAPINDVKLIRYDESHKLKKEVKYLYISGKDKIKELAKKYKTPINFFKYLETLNTDDLIHEIRIRVKKKGINGGVVFQDLSEGEQQLLTVIGLLQFFNQEETLFLLDEPDTHLNPAWKYQYIKFLKEIVGTNSSSQILMTTHEALVIGELKKENVRILRKYEDKIIAEEPEINPNEMGVEGILTNEFFGLTTTLSQSTYKKINRRRDLTAKSQKQELTPEERTELQNLFEELNEMGFTNTMNDPLFEEYLAALDKVDIPPILTKEQKEKRDKNAISILKKLKEKRKQKEKDEIH